MSLGGSAYYYTADKQILYLIFLLSFRLLVYFCDVLHLFLVVADGWHCRCSFKVYENYFSIFLCLSEVSDIWRLQVNCPWKVYWITLYINNMECREVELSYQRYLVALLVPCRDHLCNWMNLVPLSFLFMSEANFPSTQKTQQEVSWLEGISVNKLPDDPN